MLILGHLVLIQDSGNKTSRVLQSLTAIACFLVFNDFLMKSFTISGWKLKSQHEEGKEEGEYKRLRELTKKVKLTYQQNRAFPGIWRWQWWRW